MVFVRLNKRYIMLCYAVPEAIDRTISPRHAILDTVT